jgi:hypothetical protein
MTTVDNAHPWRAFARKATRVWETLLLGLALSSTDAFAVADFNFTKLYQCDPLGPSAYSDVWGSGNYAYMGTIHPSYGVHIFDITQPNCTPGVSYVAYNPTIGIDPTTGAEIKLSFLDLQVQNGYGYFASGDDFGYPVDGVHIVNVSNPMNPVLVSKINSTTHPGAYNNVHNLFIDSGILYVVAMGNAIKVYDAGVNATPQQPKYVCDIITSGGGVHDITVRNNRLYVSMLSGYTDIYDVSGVRAKNAQCPSYLTSGLIVSFYTGNYTHSSWPSSDGKILAVAQEFQSGDHVAIWDVSVSPPTRLSSIYGPNFGIPAGFGPHNPVMFDDLLFVSWYSAGVQVFDLADPRYPTLIAAYDTNPTQQFEYGNWGVYPFLGFGKILASDIWTGLFVLNFDCASAVPYRQVLSLGDGTGTANEQIKVSFIGRMTNTSSFARNPTTNVVYVCPNTLVDYVATTTVGKLTCYRNNALTANSGKLGVNDKLVCTNKPGNDTDKFFVK